MNSIAERIKEVRSEITEVAKAHQRPSESVQLIAVSKTKPATDIVAAYTAGQRHFGENYVQEAIAKIVQVSAALPNSHICWHFIGPIQSNKTRDIATHFTWVHSVDRAKTATRLAHQRPADMPPLNVLIQVNIDDEQSKAGVQPQQVMELAALISELPQLNLRGLMTIPAAHEKATDSAPSFTAMQRLFSELQAQYKQVDTLSMGMSNDWPIAVAHGATMVRIGTAIFGSR